MLLANRILIALIILITVLAAIDYLGPDIIVSTFPISTTLAVIAQHLAIIVLLLNGTLIRTRTLKVILIAIGGTIVGAAFKVMHMPGGDEIILLATIIAVVAYSVHFYFKASKRMLDILKLLTVILLFAPGAILLIDRTIADQLLFAGNAVLIITFVCFLVLHRATYIKTSS